MNWYYVANGKQVGPIPEADLQNLVTAGTVRPDTLVWHEGLTDWKPYAQVRAPAAPPPAGGVVCAECGQAFALENVVQFGTVWVCATCKPTYVQKTREGVSHGGGGSTGTATLEEVSARDYEVDIGGTISAAWQMYKGSFGSILGATITIMGLSTLCGMIPFGVGFVASLILTGPLMGGLYRVLIRRVRGEDPPIGDAFGGFKNNFKNLLLTHLVSNLLIGLCFIPAIILGVVAFIGFSQGRQTPGFELTGLMIAAFVAAGIGMLGVLYLQVCWLFAVPLVADKQMSFWPALQLSRKIVSKHWWGICGLMLTSGLVAMLGLLGCGIGILFTFPMMFLVMAHQYEKILGDLAPQGA